MFSTVSVNGRETPVLRRREGLQTAAPVAASALRRSSSTLEDPPRARYIERFMLSLNLAKIRDAHERFEQVYRPEQLAAPTTPSASSAPVSLAFDISQGQGAVPAGRARVQTTLELPCSRCLEPFTWPVDASFDLRYQPHARNTGEGEREIEEDDLTTAFYENDADRSRSADARAVLPGAADEAAVPGRLPGAVPAVRDEPESAARATARREWEDPAARGAEGAASRDS